LGFPEKSTLAEPTSKTRHSINFSITSILDIATGYMDHLIKQVIEIRHNPRNLTEFSVSVSPGTW
jgi:hypothetical protein